MSQELKPERTIPPERLAVLAKWGGNPHEEEVYWMAEELQRARAQLATRSDAHLLRSHANLVAALKSYRESHIAGNGNGHACATDPKWAEYICRRCKQADAALTEAAALEPQKENGNG
jgi:hypothetical protein